MLAVIAVSGVMATGAAAAPDSASRTVGNDTIAPGETTNVTVTVEMDGNGGPLTLNESFSPGFASASIQSITVNGQAANPLISAANANGAVVSFSGISGNATVTVTYQVTAGNRTNITHEIIGEVVGSNTTVNLGTDAITVRQDPLRATQSVTDTTVAPGKSTTVSVTIQNPRSRLTLNQSFVPGFASVSIDRVAVNGNTTKTILRASESVGAVVTLEGLSTTDTVRITTTVTIPTNASTGATFTVSGMVSSGTQTAPLSSKTISVVNPGPVAQFDINGDNQIQIQELGRAAAAFSNNKLTITELAEVAKAFAN